MARLVFAAAFVLMASPLAAQGIGREFFEKMSGPELDGWEVRVPFGCEWTDGQFVPYWNTQETRRRREANKHRAFCFDVAYASFVNSDRDEVGALVTARRFEASFIYRLDRLDATNRWLAPFEPGAALGAIGFLTDRGKVWRVGVAPRLVVKPLNAVSKLRETRWGNVIQFSVRAQWMPSVTDSDLVLGPAYEPFSDGWLWGWSPITIDLSELVGLR